MSLLNGPSIVSAVATPITGPAGLIFTAFDVLATIVQSGAIPRVLGFSTAPQPATDQTRRERAEAIAKYGPDVFKESEPSFDLARELATNPYLRAQPAFMPPVGNALLPLIGASPPAPLPNAPPVQPIPPLLDTLKRMWGGGGNAAPAPVAPVMPTPDPEPYESPGEFERMPAFIPRPTPGVLPPASVLPTPQQLEPFFKKRLDELVDALPQPNTSPEGNMRPRECVQLCEPVCKPPKEDKCGCSGSKEPTKIELSVTVNVDNKTSPGTSPAAPNITIQQENNSMSMLRADGLGNRGKSGSTNGPRAKKATGRPKRAGRAERTPRKARAPRKNLRNDRKGTKEPTAKQKAARAKFAKRSKAGEFRRTKKNIKNRK